MASKKQLSKDQRESFIALLKNRFEKNPQRHNGIEWTKVHAKLEMSHEKLWSLFEMERTGGEPDVVVFDTKAIVFVDCAVESPVGRRSTSYDYEGQQSRKEFKPENNAIDMAKEMGVEMLDEAQYRALQQLGKFDMKTSSWIKTPADIRKLGGALFADFRYGHVFVYHNGAQSYYAARGFRAVLKL